MVQLHFGVKKSNNKQRTRMLVALHLQCSSLPFIPSSQVHTFALWVLLLGRRRKKRVLPTWVPDIHDILSFLAEWFPSRRRRRRKKEKILKSFVKQNKKQHFQYEGSCQSKPFLQWFSTSSWDLHLWSGSMLHQCSSQIVMAPKGQLLELFCAKLFELRIKLLGSILCP